MDDTQLRPDLCGGVTADPATYDDHPRHAYATSSQHHWLHLLDSEFADCGTDHQTWDLNIVGWSGREESDGNERENYGFLPNYETYVQLCRLVPTVLGVNNSYLLLPFLTDWCLSERW